MDLLAFLHLPTWAIAILVVFFLVVSLVMILVVLIQKPQGGGLSGAFGASSEGAGATAFGAKTGDVLTTATISVFVLFLVVAIMLNWSIMDAQETAQARAALQPTTQTEGAGAGEPATTPGTTVIDIPIDQLRDDGDAPTDDQPDDTAGGTEDGSAGG